VATPISQALGEINFSIFSKFLIILNIMLVVDTILNEVVKVVKYYYYQFFELGDNAWVWQGVPFKLGV